MPENILVVEYEPRYTDRVRQALAGQPFTALFAKDGEEALRAIESDLPQLIVLSSVVPKVSTPELIRAIRTRNALATTPILLTVSGYNGKSPKQDAVRMGASDILPKPYSESEFLGKVQQMLGVKAASPATGAGFTSNEIFGDLLEEGAPSGARKTAMKPKDDVDKMLADTLAGMMPQKKTTAPAPPKPQAPPPAAPPKATVEAPRPAEAKPRTQSTSDLDKLLSDTLSGTRKPGTPTQAGTVATPRPPAAPPPPAPPKPAAPPPTQTGTAPSGKYITEKLTFPKPEKVLVAQPVFTQAAAAAAPPIEEEEPTDGIKFGQYVLLEKIATGGMAEVWKARMRGVEGFQKTVAIKKILPHLSDNQDFIEMFIDEAKLAAQLNHNNIIHIYDLGKIQSSYYIAMEYIDGYDLKSILKLAADRDQPLSVELALFVASKIAAALDYAHRKRDFEDRDLGLVHRDVSPQNVLISKEGDIKLCDFGIAKAASKASHTQAGALKGKLQYMSPEQAWGRAIDKRSDIFALATVLFELLTGRKLFTGDNELSILEQVREARITTPSHYNDEVTPQIDAIVVKALQKDPANRYQTAGEMERDINQVLYTFKPTPTAADLAIYMHRLESSEASAIHVAPHIAEPEPVREPGQLKPVAAPAPVAVPVPAPVPVEAEPAVAAYVPPSSTDKKLPIVPIGIAAAVVVLLVVGWLVMRKPSATATATKSPVVPTSATAATNPAVGQANAAPALGIPSTATTATFDPAAVDAEVKKRLAAQQSAQQAKLDAEAKKQQTPTQIAQTQTTRPTPQPVVPVPQPVAPAPQPVAPAPQPVAQQPVPQPVAPAPQPVEPQVARAREGDLIPAGTEGLNPPRMTRQAPPTYPPVARIQRIEGAVLMSVLVSESGAVQDVRVIRGDPRLTEAAVQSVRRSGFSAGTKDGVRVKSWIPVTISFKL
jgi:TonB family protein